MQTIELFFFACYLATSTSGQAQNENINRTEVERILRWKGYMSEEEEEGSKGNETAMSQALELYQEYMDIRITGVMDEDTWKKMLEPQCGVGDEHFVQRDKMTKRRRKRFALVGSDWSKRRVTYRINSLPNLNGVKIGDKKEAQNEVRRAFKVWSDVSQLEFLEVESKEKGVKVDIEISSESLIHREPFNARSNGFDGRGKVLAHAFFPKIGDIHFDDDEIWTLDKKATNFFLVSVHEIGHSLGLGHSHMGTLMHASYNPNLDIKQPLHKDDIMGIQALYGVKSLPSLTTRPTSGLDGRQKPRPTSGTVSPPPTDFCKNVKMDAVTTTADGKIYIFKDEHYWELTTSGLSDNSPRQIDDDWNGIEGKVDAAITTSDGITFIFQGDNFYRFRNKVALVPFKEKIVSQFKGVPSNIQAAFIWPLDGRIHFIIGGTIWRYRYNSNYNARRVTTLRRLGVDGESPIDAAFTFNNAKTYLFQGDRYYKLSMVPARVASGYPKSIGVNFFACKEEAEGNGKSGVRTGKLLELNKDKAQEGNVLGTIFQPNSVSNGDYDQRTTNNQGNPIQKISFYKFYIFIFFILFLDF